MRPGPVVRFGMAPFGKGGILDTSSTIAYFTMEIGLDAAMPTYSGGLGVLAGDTVQSAADMGIPMVVVSLLHRKGYFYQRLDSNGRQTEEPVEWPVEDFVQRLEPTVEVVLAGRPVRIRAWVYEVKGYKGAVVPVLLLDTAVEGNDEQARALTDHLYGGDLRYRLCQEAVLGMGGTRMLRALGFNNIRRFHMNEGHAALLTLELLDAALADGRMAVDEAVEAVRRQCIFTTHTPVPAGHDQFDMDLVRDTLGGHKAFDIPNVFCCDNRLNMTYLALNLSHYVNGVAKKHGEVSRQLFANYRIDSITNGVHAERWTCMPFRELYDQYIPGWCEDNFSLRYALSIPLEKIRAAHIEAKRELMNHVNHLDNSGMDLETFTIGYARRATAYKRPGLIFTDLERLRAIAKDAPMQLIFAGKAHPRDEQGKQLIQTIHAARTKLRPHIKLSYLPNYDMEIGQWLTSGVDLWLNTPQPPMEASGTSGMKAALNGVPSLSILDGWWIEGCIEGVTGWAIGTPLTDNSTGDSRARDAASLYDKLEHTILPLYYRDPKAFSTVMAHAIALNGSFFNTQRMVQQYAVRGYLL